MKFPIILACSLFISILLPESLQAASSARIVTGNVIANRTVTLATRIMGRITQVHASEGETVNEGQVIVDIDDTEYSAQLRSSEAAEDRAQAELAHRQLIKNRLTELAKKNAIAQDAIDEAIYLLAVAVANLKMAQAQIETIRATLAETQIKVPFDAVVIKKFAETGLVTQPGQPLFEIQDQSQLKFRARVKERDLAHIKLNDTAQITITALGDEPVSANVIRVIPNGDDRHTFIIELALPDRPGLYPGMFGKAVFAQ
jgi:RND family efflux transporter MFP subunit